MSQEPERVRLHLGDCASILRGLPSDSVDSIVTDPPYGLSFMGKRWDYDVPGVEIWAECLRVLKPGGHLLAFAGTRTQHRMAVRIEDAGFEIRDMIAWVYGSGFPKSHNLDGAWEGWGTALKPALEPITVARKPLIGTVAANVLAHGTGALNIDGCRVPVMDAQYARNCSGDRGHAGTRETDAEGVTNLHAGGGSAAAGRWPANLIHDGSDEVVTQFPDNAGAAAPVHKRNFDKFRNSYGAFAGNIDEAGSTFRGDNGSAARFFYCPKASRSDRNEGLPSSNQPAVANKATMRAVEDAEWPARNGNHHPTVKPTDLMAYLCRLVTPSGGVVLDPFMGSGSTGKAAVREGFRFIGIERDLDEHGNSLGYIEIARARIAHEEARIRLAETQLREQQTLFNC